ncbi:MAG: NAD(P)H-dependent glycerol-3-phosphate dehydrogenase [Candidatus Planktophila sp.]
MSKVTVFGAGAWGCTMAQVLSDAGNEVVLWGRSADVIDEINSKHTNEKYLATHVLPSNISATTNVDEAFAFSNTYVLAIPAQQLRTTLQSWKEYFKPRCTIISTLKGIEISTQMRMTEVIAEVLGLHQVAIITGPNLADELVLRQPAGAVAAASTQELSEEVRSLFATAYYRVYTSVDVMGCELAGAIKSVIALAVGISIGMGYGENTQAMLITRGLNEVARLCAAHGADPLSAAGLAGMGDLVASCGSPLSRNRTFGEALGRTGSMSQARALVAKTVEGVASAGAVTEIAHRVGIEVPVIEAVGDIVSEQLTPEAAFQRLMEITTKAENFIR